MNHISPINYKLHIEPDLEKFTFSGTTGLILEATAATDEISLNALELAIRTCKIKVDDRLVACPFHMEPKKEEIIISLPKKMSGEITLAIDYMGQINDKMAGFYRSQYTSNGKTKYIAVTQFEESDARRAFPCVDHPFKKATFDIEIVIDEELKAISNSPIKEESPRSEEKKLVVFQRTPIMSTYLLFFGVGPFEFIVDEKDNRVRGATMPGMSKHVKFGIDFGRKSLGFCEDFYGIDYPIPKLDLIAIPDFAFGAMENWGAITFRENLLLHFPDITSQAGEERICEVIAHEIVHQWFGNLVTPSDWKYLWLNESFATYFGFSIVDTYYPDWGVWGQFLHSQTDIALNRDALHETLPIEIPGGEHVVINTSTAPIIYNKGGSVLIQIKEYMGDDSFKKGLRQYLNKYKYACALSRHLWESFEEMSEKPIIKIMKSWIEQKGFPVVEAKRDADKLVFTQKRFTYLPNDSDQKWLIPLNVRVFYEDGGSEILSTLLDDKQGSIDIDSNIVAYKVNDKQTGFYRVTYLEKDNLDQLGKLVSQEGLSPEDRWGLQNDLYSLVRSSTASIDDYLEFLSNYTHERAFLPLTSIANNLSHAYLVMGDKTKEKIAATGKLLAEEVLSIIGYDPNAKESHSISILRDQLIWNAVTFGSEAAEEFALDKFSLLMKGESIHQDIMKSVMQVGALDGDDKVFDWFDKRLETSESEHDRMNILAALGTFSKTTLIERALGYILDKVPNRNKFIPIVSMAANPHAIPHMWDWYTSHIEALEHFHPLHYERVIAGLVPMCGIGREEEVKDFFKTYMSHKEMNTDVIKLSLERLEINCRIREYNKNKFSPQRTQSAQRIRT
ncbi:MAG: M1 family metallopeptidase [Desulfobacterales bacterium]|nr:M1 family metallopeptidase [Desulfobacterales bacterium]